MISWRDILRVAVLSVPLAFNAQPAPGAESDTARYRAVPLRGEGSRARLVAELGKERFLDVLKVNRLDRIHALRADTLVVPAAGLTLRDLSPWPSRVAQADSIEKVILVALRIQAFAAYEKGRLVRWGPVCSGGRGAETSPGRYFANWKDRLHVSSVDRRWIMPWTVNIDMRVGTALHQYSLPGRPSSHCCIRLLEDDARWIYRWVEVGIVSPDGREIVERGTPVILFGAYDFASPPPWKRLPVDAGATDVPEDELGSAFSL